MSTARTFARAVALSLLARAAQPAPAAAQSLLVGIPSADVTERGRVGLTHESQALVVRRPFAWNSFSFVTYGVAEHVEASLSLTGLSQPAYGDLVLGVGFKWVVPVLPSRASRWELRATVGASALFSLDRAAVGGWGYAHASARIPGIRTRLTAGVSYGDALLFGPGAPPVSFIGGVEQPITGWLSLVADWYSGTHALGALIPAVQFNVAPWTFIVGYKRDNDRTAPRDGIIAEVMVLL